MESFLQPLADLLLERHRHELDRIAVVLPGRRAGVHLRKYLAQRAGAIIWSPELFDPGAFLQRIAGMRQGGSMELLFLLHEAHRSLEGDRAEPLGEFLQWAPVTLRDMSEVDAHLLDLDQLYRDLRAYHEIEEWSFLGSGPLGPSQQRSIQQWARTGTLHRHFAERMAARRMGTSGAVARKAAEVAGDAQWRSPWAMVWFAGLNALEPATTEVVRRMLANGSAQVVWDTDRYYLDDPDQEAGRYLRRSIKDLGAGALPPGTGIVERERRIDVVTVPNRVAQAYHAAQWLTSLPLEERARTVVVLADESLLLPLFDALPAGIGPMNVTMGLALTALPVHGLVEAFLRVHANADNGMPLADLERLLLHPFLQEGARTSALLAELRSSGPARFGAAALEMAARRAGLVHAGPMLHALAPVHTGSDVHARIRDLIAWAQDSRAGDPLVNEQLFRLAKAEHALEHLLARQGMADLDAEAYRSLRQRALRDERLDLYGEPLTGLQVMGLLETRGIDHERVLLLGANEDALPGDKGSQSWIPFDLRRHHGLPLRADADAISAYHVHRLLHHAREVRLVCHSGGDGSGEPTRFIAQWRHELEPRSRTRMVHHVQHVPMPARSNARIAVAKTPEVLARLDELAAKGFSPTTLGTWLRCPLDFHITHVLGIRPAEVNDGTLGSDVLGSAVHRTLENIYRPLLGRVLDPTALLAAAAETPTLLRSELLKEFPAHILAEGHFRLRLEMAAQAIASHLEREAERCAGSATIPLALETMLTIALDARTNLRGVCDRMEERDGLLHVIDLKTGGARQEDLRLRSLDRADLGPTHRYALQLVMYAFMALRNDTSLRTLRAGIVPLRKASEAQGLWLTIGGSDLIDRSMLAPMGALLEQLIAEVRDPAVPFMHDPASKWCTGCTA